MIGRPGRLRIAVAGALAAAAFACLAATTLAARRDFVGRTSQGQPVALRVSGHGRLAAEGSLGWVARCGGGKREEGVVLLPRTALQYRRSFRLRLLLGSFVQGYLRSPRSFSGTLLVRTLEGCSTPLVHWRAAIPATPCTAWGDGDCDVDDKPGTKPFRSGV